MSEEDLDTDYYSKVLKQQARNESDKIRDLKRKIEDNQEIQGELTDEEYELLTSALQHEVENLETMASKSREFLEEKMNETDQD